MNPEASPSLNNENNAITSNFFNTPNELFNLGLQNNNLNISPLLSPVSNNSTNPFIPSPSLIRTAITQVPTSPPIPTNFIASSTPLRPLINPPSHTNNVTQHNNTNPFVNYDTQNDLKQTNNSINKLVGAINNLVLNNNYPNSTSNIDKIDIRHIDSFNGEGNPINVSLKLKTFLADIEEISYERHVTEHQMLLLAKKKLDGPAKSLVTSHRPTSYSDLVTLLNKSFSFKDGPHEEVLDQLKTLKLQPTQNFIQLVTKAKDLANLAANKLACSTSNRMIFDAFAKGLLSNFAPFVKVQGKVTDALTSRDCDKLIDVLHNLLILDDSILIKDESINIAHFKNKNYKKDYKDTNQDNKTNNEEKCQLCNASDHKALKCPKFAEKQSLPPTVKDSINNNLSNSSNQVQNTSSFYTNTSRQYQPCHTYQRSYQPRYFQPRHNSQHFNQPRQYRPRNSYFNPYTDQNSQTHNNLTYQNHSNNNSEQNFS